MKDPPLCNEIPPWDKKLNSLASWESFVHSLYNAVAAARNDFTSCKSTRVTKHRSSIPLTRLLKTPHRRGTHPPESHKEDEGNQQGSQRDTVSQVVYDDCNVVMQLAFLLKDHKGRDTHRNTLGRWETDAQQISDI